jgi:8-oxo-dGTP pyrophosphatase MutT (NUDIX family)
LEEALSRRITKEDVRHALSRRQKGAVEAEGFTPAAVLIPLYEKAGEHYLVVTKRTETVNYHRGQISFPGGVHQVGDESLMDTALRESWEEIGLNPRDVEILGELDSMCTFTTNYVVSPFVAAIPYPYEFRANPGEVEEIIEVPLAALLDRSNFREELQPLQGRLIPQYFYQYGDRVIWGATARILKQFLQTVFRA